MIYLHYHGWVTISTWEYFLALFFIVVTYVWFSRVKLTNIKRSPEYKYFIWGYLARVVGGVFYTMIYFYYYRGGDSVMYFYSSVAMANLAMRSPLDWLTVLFGANTHEHLALFTPDTAYPYEYIFTDPRTWMVIRLLSPLTLLSMKSYLVTTVLMASFTYVGVWRCFRMMVGYFPALTSKLAIAFLFVPSVIFWGSGVSKDTFTFTGTCFFVYAVDRWFFKRDRSFGTIFAGLVSGALVLYIKPYILMALVPSMLLWILYARITGIRNALIRLVVVPFAFLLLVGGSFVILNGLGDKLGKFSLENALATTALANADMTSNAEYSANYFDIGPMDGTWSGLLSKAPTAVFAALFRPRLDEARNPVMLISGLENTWLLGLLVMCVVRVRIVGLPRFIFGNPIVLMCFAFAVVFGFIIGISTPNFGALVRFKIPMLPFFVTGLLIINYFVRLDRWYRKRNKVLNLSTLRQGTAHLRPEDDLPEHRRGQRGRPSVYRPRPVEAG